MDNPRKIENTQRAVGFAVVVSELSGGKVFAGAVWRVFAGCGNSRAP